MNKAPATTNQISRITSAVHPMSARMNHRSVTVLLRADNLFDDGDDDSTSTDIVNK